MLGPRPATMVLPLSSLDEAKAFPSSREQKIVRHRQYRRRVFRRAASMYAPTTQTPRNTRVTTCRNVPDIRIIAAPLPRSSVQQAESREAAAPQKKFKKGFETASCIHGFARLARGQIPLMWRSAHCLIHFWNARPSTRYFSVPLIEPWKLVSG